MQFVFVKPLELKLSPHFNHILVASFQIHYGGLYMQKIWKLSKYKQRTFL